MLPSHVLSAPASSFQGQKNLRQDHFVKCTVHIDLHTTFYNMQIFTRHRLEKFIYKISFAKQ